MPNVVEAHEDATVGAVATPIGASAEAGGRSALRPNLRLMLDRDVPLVARMRRSMRALVGAPPWH